MLKEVTNIKSKWEEYQQQGKSLSLTLSLSLCVSLCVSLCLSHTLYLSLSLYVSLSSVAVDLSAVCVLVPL